MCKIAAIIKHTHSYLRAGFAFAAIFVFTPFLLEAQQDTLNAKPVEKKKIVIHNSDLTWMITTDSGTLNRFKGNVIMEHNKAVMTCDSAIMYPNNVFEAMGHAKITSGTTTVTGDDMTYDGRKAEVRGRIVYLTDGSSTLRTCKVDFDTETETGFFENEGTIIDSLRLLESQKGYYHSKIKEFEFFGMVEADAKKYVLRSDSMKYNTQTKLFTFYSSTHIWTENGYLYSDLGWYDSEQDIMFFYKNSYILSPKQEIFADSIYYESVAKKGKLYSNVQVADTAKRTVALADFADFDINTEDFIMRKNPSIISFDDKDTTYIRADTIFSINIFPTVDSVQKTADSITQKSLSKIDTTQSVSKHFGKIADKLNFADTVNKNTSVEKFVDSLNFVDTVSKNISVEKFVDSLNFADTISKNISTENIAEIPDSLHDKTIAENLLKNPKPVQDGLSNEGKSLQDAVYQNTKPADSVYKELFAFHNVKLFRKDFQLICDSLFFRNIDSVWKVYKNPVVWNGKKMQITADSMKFFMKDGDLNKADFYSNAMILSPEGRDSTVYFNQIKAKNIDVLFKNRTLSVLNAYGNLQTLAFSLAELTMNKGEASSMKMTFDSLGKLRRMAYYSDSQADNNPLFLVPQSEIRLPGFKSKFELRPTSGVDILNRIFRQSERKERESILKPTFPITAKIDKIEEELISTK